MRANTFFWGAILILVGGLLLLSSLGFLNVNIWGILGPALVILVGVWILWGILFRKGVEVEQANVSLEGASKARLHIKHGAGRLRVYAGAGKANLAEGEFGGGLDLVTKRIGDLLEVTMSPRKRFWVFPFSWSPGTLDWSFGLTREVPLSLELDAGANEARIDLEELQVGKLHLRSGASSTELTLPANAGFTRAEISTGAASVRVKIPSGVAARIRYRSGLASVIVDRGRFPRSGDAFQSPDYDSAPNKVDLDIETGVGSVEVR